MRPTIAMLFLSLTYVCTSCAYDIYLKSGVVYKGATLRTDGARTVITSGARIDTVESSAVDRVLFDGADPTPKTPVPQIQSAPAAITTLEMSRAFSRYEEEKKERSMGLLLSLIVPGGGLFYADDPGSGILFLLAHAAAVSWIASSGEGTRTLPIISLVALRIWEGATVRAEIDDCNSDLRSRLFIGRGATQKTSPLLSLTIKL